jgi:hypothetical protein
MKIGDKVMITTQDDELDGMSGEIIGISPAGVRVLLPNHDRVVILSESELTKCDLLLG